MGEAGAAPETHEQRIAVHRVLKDRSFASAVRARASDGTGSLAGALLETTTAKIRGLVARRGITGMLSLKRDAAGRINGGRFLGGRVRGSFTHPEFIAFAEAAGWFLTQEEANALWSSAREEAARGGSPASDVAEDEGMPGPGAVLVGSLFRVICPPLPARRAALVAAAWGRLATDATLDFRPATLAHANPLLTNGRRAPPAPTPSMDKSSVDVLSVARIAERFCADGHPEVRASKKSTAAVTADLLSTLGLVDARGVNSVSQALFNEYYRDVSSCVPDDAFFEALLEGCWPAATRVLQGGGISTARDAITRAPGAVDSGARGPPSIFDDFSVSKGSGLDSVTASAALRKRLSAVSDLAIAHLFFSLLHVDSDADGLVSVDEFRGALRGTIGICIDVDSSVAGTRVGTVAAAVGAVVRTPAVDTSAQRVTMGGPHSPERADGRRRMHAGQSPDFQRTGGAVGRVDDIGSGRGGTAAPLVVKVAVENPFYVPDADAHAVFASFAKSRGLDPDEPVPLVELYRTICGPESSSPARAAVVSSLWSELDVKRLGAIPVTTLLNAFRANELPAVAGGRYSTAHAFRVFNESFGDAFSLVDSRGPSRRLRGGPSAEAYSGLGDGAVRSPFFVDWNRGLSAACADDAAFALVAHRVWSPHRAGGVGGGGARAADGEAGLISRISELGGAHAHKGIRGAVSIEVEGMSATMKGLLPGPASRATHAATRGGGLATLTATGSTANPGTPLASTHQQPPQPGGFEDPRFATGLSGHALAANAPTVGYARRATGAHSEGIYAAAAAAGGADDVVEAMPPPPATPLSRPLSPSVTSVVRKALLAGGPRASLSLARALEVASAVCASPNAPPPRGARRHLAHPIPVSALIACLRDVGAILDARGVAALSDVTHEDYSARGSAPTQLLSPLSFLLAVHPSLPPARAAVVERAFTHVRSSVAREAASGKGHAVATLTDAHMLFQSAAHPDVRAGKRADEEVLREFLEFFSGPTIGGERGAPLSLDGFSTFYTLLALHTESDAAFAAILFDTWGLGYAATVSQDPHAPGAGARVGNSNAQPTALPHAPDVSVSSLLGGAAPMYRYGPRGPGPEGLPTAAYTTTGRGDDFTARADAQRERRGWGVEKY